MAGTTDQDVIELLLVQHEQIRALITQVRTETGDVKRESFEDLLRLLAVHETAEEEVVHPTARRKIANGERVVDARLNEESQAKDELSELYDLGVDHSEFDTRFAALADAVEKHASHEESEEFPGLRRELPADDLQKMAGAVRAAEAVAPTRPHPAAGESAVAQMLLGPPVAVFDRVRDAFRDWGKTNKGS
ncbi:hemerythrin domain-containing protein [Actinopolymorpha pittospori]|uniref:Hemerythrin-like domain-containing protein n=1 Tax=Actinopolymorpha pittospori TaxID=648752 RepID=A0A927MMF6_9ACTN|nr:hemerythrin domain-containing protein [Actinopolymorpha pittospori]MBE1603365.1 hemerythrin-like domain-containing protein [Actinopolymorpha pittospori]